MAPLTLILAACLWISAPPAGEAAPPASTVSVPKQEPSDSITVSAKFEPGELVRLECIKSKRFSNASHSPEPEILRAVVDLLVLDRKEKLTELQWSVRSQAGNGVSEEEAAAANAMVSEVPPLRLLVDGDGRIVDVVNWKEVRDATEVLSEKLLRAKGRSEEAIRTSMAVLRSAYSGEDGAKALLLQDAGVYFLACGKTVGLENALVEAVDVGLSSFEREFRLLPRREGMAEREVSMNDSLPPKLVAAFVKPLFDAIQTKGRGDADKVREAMATGKVVDKGRITFDPGTSTVRSVTVERTVAWDDFKVVQSTEYRLVSREKHAPAPEPRVSPAKTP